MEKPGDLSEWILLAEKGDSSFQYKLGNMYVYGEGVPLCYETAVTWFTLAAEQGLDVAQHSLATMYDNGDGTPKNAQTAVKWFTLAAEQGYALAQVSLGVMYANGEGVLQDYREMSKWFRLAAEQGMPEAQFNLGYMYHHGEGSAQDSAKASKWYRLAAEQGSARAQHALGLLYAHSDGGAEDDAEMFMWYRLAAEQGMPEAQFKLGEMYASGKDVPKNSESAQSALKWYRLAAEQGHDEAQRTLLRIELLAERSTRISLFPHLKTEADIQFEIQIIAELTPEERGYNLGQTLVSLVSFMEPDPEGKLPLFPNPVTPEQHAAMNFFMAHLLRLSHLGGMSVNSALEDSLHIFAEMVDEIVSDKDRLDLGIKFVEKLSDR